ncbi:MAG: tetratricopeptide repeat protein [Pseudomonadota bacterium]
MALAFADDRLDATNRARIAFNAGVAAMDIGRLEIALARLDTAIALDAALAPARVSRAFVRARRGDPDGALEDYGAAIEADPGSAAPYLGRGRLLLDIGQPEAAIADFDAALEREGDWAASYLERGRAQFALQRWGEAERDFSAVIARNPRSATAWLSRAEARAAAGGSGARNDFDRAVALAPEWAAARYARGVFLDDTGATAQAEADFLRAYELGFRSPDLEARVRSLSGG